MATYRRMRALSALLAVFTQGNVRAMLQHTTTPPPQTANHILTGPTNPAKSAHTRIKLQLDKATLNDLDKK